MKKKKKPKGPTSGVDLGAVEQVLEFMTQNGIEEFEYSNGNFHIRLKKPSAHTAFVPRPLGLPEILIPGPSPAPAAGSAVDAATLREEEEAAGRGEDLHIVKSPIVGTFYGAPSPGAEAFVKVGDRVETGQVLCIIEAMKLMNEIESDAAGEIIRVYVENGQPVEYGESLFALRTTRRK